MTTINLKLQAVTNEKNDQLCGEKCPFLYIRYPGMVEYGCLLFGALGIVPAPVSTSGYAGSRHANCLAAGKRPTRSNSQ